VPWAFAAKGREIVAKISSVTWAAWRVIRIAGVGPMDTAICTKTVKTSMEIPIADVDSMDSATSIVTGYPYGAETSKISRG
jgi:hypothetical protein